MEGKELGDGDEDGECVSLFYSCVFYLWKGSKRDEQGKESGGSFVFICSLFSRLEWQMWKMDGLFINLDFD